MASPGQGDLARVERAYTDFTEAILRMRTNPGNRVLRRFDRTVTGVHDSLSMVDSFASIHVAALDDSLLAGAERVFTFGASPPWNIDIVRIRVRRAQHERRHEFERKRVSLL